MIRFAHLISLLGILLITACSQDKPVTNPSTAFRQFLADNFAQDMAQKPRTATRRGYYDNNREWNPYSEAFHDLQRQQWEARLAALADYDPALLPRADALSWQLYSLELERNIASDEFRHHNYIIDQFGGLSSRVPTFLANMQPVNNEQDMEDYIARLNAVDTLFAQVGEQLQIRTEKGIFLPDWSYPQVITTLQNTVAGAPFDENGTSDLWADVQRKLAGLGLEADQRQRLQDAAKSALLNVVEPAYLELIGALETQAALAPAGDGVWKHPDGDAFYAERLAYYTTTDLTAEEIHRIGLQQVSRVQDEMRAIMEQIGYEDDLRSFMVHMRESPEFYYANDAEGRERYLREAASIIDNMRARLPEAFSLFPKAELVVKRVEVFREASAGKAFYQAPPQDGSRPGIYYANLSDMNAMPIYQMEALAYHEGIPGHHMQRAISIEMEDIPEFQKYASFTAYTEGWGLYSEQLPREMGLYQDPYSDFGRLAMELWRAARLVVDTGLHHKRWTREQAIEYLVANTPNARYDCTRAIERYAVRPGQATAYMIGKLKILELREFAKSTLREQFDIREFHDEVLKDGPVPLSILEDKIERWVASQQA